MCGIIAGVSHHADIKTRILKQLKKLEYRGYDSAGIATITENQIEALHTIEDIDTLFHAAQKRSAMQLAIAHTRWATHGKVSVTNAHPHTAGGRIALVHNGIIENHNELKQTLLNDTNICWRSTTDSEVIAQLIYQKAQTNTIETAIVESVKLLKGTFALAIIDAQSPGKLYCIAHESSLMIGRNKDVFYVSSDQNALLEDCTEACQAPKDQLIVITSQAITPKATSDALKWQCLKNFAQTLANEKNTYANVTHKEIHEQPEVIQRLINTHITNDTQVSNLPPGLSGALRKHRRIKMVACGSSYYSALVGKYWIEAIAKVPVTVELASEIRYRNPVIEPETLLVTLSQSGETLDTISAQRYLYSIAPELVSLTIGNNLLSTLASESHYFWSTQAGPEIGVATTKVFTAQIFCLACICLEMCDDPEKKKAILENLSQIPQWIQEVLSHENSIKRVANRLKHDQAMIICARGHNYPVAQEAALKLKELAYIHASAYASGELKHGPLALIEPELTTLFFITKDTYLSKTQSSISEVLAREGKVLLIGAEDAFQALNIPESEHLKFTATTKQSPPIEISAFTNVVGAQLLTYHTADIKGCAIDKPRNLAKCVTVE